MKKFLVTWFILIFCGVTVGCKRDNFETTTPNELNKKQSIRTLDNYPNSTQKAKQQSNQMSYQYPLNISTTTYLRKEKRPDGKVVNVTNYPSSIGVIVNKKIYLPKNYVPKDLIYPNTTFLFKEKVEKRKLRREAALQLEKMFTAAKKDGINLSGVSGYRSYATQTVVFNNYVKRDGYQKAITYSAIPGTSEHQTGLAIDVSGTDGKCAVTSCFAATKEAKWLEKNSANYGYIIRFPKGKEHVTGYKYEPWHIRYVGTGIAKDMQARGLTLEEYFGIFPILK
ncbi:M15 family metallopeptidase [Bacillus sp. JJ1764]|uniref:M15 family metallopeptidase n=1 Tax=Bacillus sp. JJ1764 TaxID=3122964 RepID=UPI002FFD62BF